jgi:wyosine [tRNA(Phe)-imidazoG37] synthetase (radical SAM superfamily)
VVNQRREYFPRHEILSEIEQALCAHQAGEIDWVTFVGSGELTLHQSIGWLIHQVKAISDLPVAVITNGALLYKPEVRAELSAADAVLPSLDAGSTSLYRKINRPHPKATYERLVEGLKRFRKEYSGRLWVEVMLVRGLNDTESALKDIAAGLAMIQPDEVHINLPSRPPVEAWVFPADNEGLLRARAILGSIATVVHPAQGEFELSQSQDPLDGIIGIIKRHPVNQAELECILEKWAPGREKALLAGLRKDPRLREIERYGVKFWIVTNSFFPDEKGCRSTASQDIA